MAFWNEQQRETIENAAAALRAIADGLHVAIEAEDDERVEELQAEFENLLASMTAAWSVTKVGQDWRDVYSLLEDDDDAWRDELGEREVSKHRAKEWTWGPQWSDDDGFEEAPIEPDEADVVVDFRAEVLRMLGPIPIPKRQRDALDTYATELELHAAFIRRVLKGAT